MNGLVSLICREEGGGIFCLLADTPGRHQQNQHSAFEQAKRNRAHSRIAVRYKAAGATMIDFGGSMP
jgi:hypothetical protein